MLNIVLNVCWNMSILYITATTGIFKGCTHCSWTIWFHQPDKKKTYPSWPQLNLTRTILCVHHDDAQPEFIRGGRFWSNCVSHSFRITSAVPSPEAKAIIQTGAHPLYIKLLQYAVFFKAHGIHFDHHGEDALYDKKPRRRCDAPTSCVYVITKNAGQFFRWEGHSCGDSYGCPPVEYNALKRWTIKIKSMGLRRVATERARSLHSIPRDNWMGFARIRRDF